MAASKNGIENAIRADVARAARALMGWTPQELADKSGVPLRTIARLELGEGSLQRRTLAAIRAALEAAGGGIHPRERRRAGRAVEKTYAPQLLVINILAIIATTQLKINKPSRLRITVN